MVILLYIIGVIVFIASLVTGFGTGTALGVILGIAGGISSAIVFFALAKIIENQQNMFYMIETLNSFQRESQSKEKKTCPKCNRIYDISFSSCPHCGYRE